MNCCRKTIVVSAVNLSEGGPLTVLRECLSSASSHLPPTYQVVALVHDQRLLNIPRINFVDFPRSKKSWFFRLYYEYFYFRRFSKRVKPALWLSLHDITPRVEAHTRAVYCHNPSPFYELPLQEARLEPKLLLFNLFYKYLYKTNISSNDFVIVQQEWLRKEFSRFYDQNKIVVAHPTVAPLPPSSDSALSYSSSDKKIFLYPTLPRVFKNIEILCQAVEMLPPALLSKVELRLTLSGQENAYARAIFRRYGHIPAIKFIGRQSREALTSHYSNCDVVVFPSKLETWGLPITEAKAAGKPLIVADLPYARETVGKCEAVIFLAPDDVSQWSSAMADIVTTKGNYGTSSPLHISEPYAADWHQLWDVLIQGLEQQ